MVDSPRCVYGDDCPQKKLSERRIVESLDKYRKETIEKYDLCDGTLLSKVTVLEGDVIDGQTHGYRKTEEKWRTETDRPPSKNRCPLSPMAGRRPSTISNCSAAPLEEPLPPKEEFIEILWREKELPKTPFHASSPDFPLCEYRPPRPVSEATHHESISIYDSFNSKKSKDKSRCESPAVVPRRFSIRVDERSLNEHRGSTPKLPKPMERLSIHVLCSDKESLDFKETGILNRNAPPRLSVTSAPPDTTFYEDRKKNSIHFRTEECSQSDFVRQRSLTPTPPPVISEPLGRKHQERQSVRTSSRSSENHFYRSRTINSSGRRRPKDRSPPRRYSPEPMGDQPRVNYEIPVCRDYDRYVLYGDNRRPERTRLQEETVTKETFERVTTTRRMFPSTLV